MKLSIGDNEAKILRAAAPEEEADMHFLWKATEVKVGSMGVTIFRMVEKGWLRVVREDPLEWYTPVQSTKKIYSITPLGVRALRAYEVYNDEELQ